MVDTVDGALRQDPATQLPRPAAGKPAAERLIRRKVTVRASPTLAFNEGRQILTGNVGYRVLEANVRELLRHPVGQPSWGRGGEAGCGRRARGARLRRSRALTGAR